MPWMMMTCGGCGHQDDIDEFCRTPISGELPRHVYQCPRCGLAIERRVSGPGTRYESGLYVPGPVELVRVEARL
jgi:hypothetical protein